MQISILNNNNSYFKTSCLLFTLILIGYIGNTNIHACTIFYSSQNGKILAGNNEDWKDPDTHMWFYTASDSSLGWVKFGFGSGFPQGGMNEAGLFWDGTAGPYLDMPDSEANKVLFNGALMQKVIAESVNIPEALEIFTQYYCEDQYRAQYLLGDSSGFSMIVEGDDVILKENTFQVLTNFYQSHPELGGYPCWRYETAIDYLENCDSLTTWFTGTVLASTHQEGKYPTQYSSIYDLKNRIIYLFYNHNFEEYLEINLMDELEKGYNSYAIPQIFSKVRIHDQLIGSTSVTLKWRGLPNSQYEIVISKNPDFNEALITCSKSINIIQKHSYTLIILVVVFLSSSMLILFSKQNRWSLVPLIICICLLIKCDKEEEVAEEIDNTIEFSKIIEELEPETIYYWKIKSSTGYCDNFITESATQSFKTLSD